MAFLARILGRAAARRGPWSAVLESQEARARALVTPVEVPEILSEVESRESRSPLIDPGQI